MRACVCVLFCFIFGGGLLLSLKGGIQLVSCKRRDSGDLRGDLFESHIQMTLDSCPETAILNPNDDRARHGHKTGRGF